MLGMVHLITAWLILEQQTLGGCVDVKSLCVDVYSETLPGCSKDRGGPPTGGVGGAPPSQPVEDEAAGRGGGPPSPGAPSHAPVRVGYCACRGTPGRRPHSTVTCRWGPGRRRDGVAGSPYSSPPLVLPGSLRRTMTPCQGQSSLRARTTNFFLTTFCWFSLKCFATRMYDFSSMAVKSAEMYGFNHFKHMHIVAQPPPPPPPPELSHLPKLRLRPHPTLTLHPSPR